MMVNMDSIDRKKEKNFKILKPAKYDIYLKTLFLQFNIGGSTCIETEFESKKWTTPLYFTSHF